MNILTLNIKRGSILSLLLYFIGTVSGIIINYYFIRYITFKVDLMFVITFIYTFFLHELTHYLVYRVISKVDKNQLYLSRVKKYDLPYFKSDDYINRGCLFLYLILPFLTTTVTIVIVNVLTGNFAYSFLLGIACALSGADLEIANQLYKNDTRNWKSLDNEFGFLGSN